MGLKGLRVNELLGEFVKTVQQGTRVCASLLRVQGGWAIKTIQQGDHPNVTASNLVLSKSVRRLLASLVVRDFLMNTDRNRIRAQSKHAVDCVRNFSRGNPRCTLGHGGNGRDQGFAFQRDTCGVVVTHATFLCILSAHMDEEKSRFVTQTD